ncbi:MAG: hypothetical protein MK007_01740 [Flavobacteriales bacterium]|jgi:uncharacterized membrane protein|nr:hypothetical protein [Flavobacteriales bacterium]
MKWLNIRGLVITIIIFILLNSFLDNLSYSRDGGLYNVFNTLDKMVDDFTIGTRGSRNVVDTLIYIKGNTVIALLISVLYLTIFLKKKK